MITVMRSYCYDYGYAIVLLWLRLCGRTVMITVMRSYCYDYDYGVVLLWLRLCAVHIVMIAVMRSYCYDYGNAVVLLWLRLCAVHTVTIKHDTDCNIMILMYGTFCCTHYTACRLVMFINTGYRDWRVINTMYHTLSCCHGYAHYSTVTAVPLCL